MAFLWHLTALELKDKVLVTGTALKNKTQIDKSPKSILANAWYVLSSYKKKAYKNKLLSIKTKEESFEIKTNKKGYFFKILPVKSLLDFAVFDESHNKLKIHQTYPYYFKNNAESVEIISDIDDTVIHSHTSSALKRIFTILFKRPKRRKKVIFSNSLLNFFDDNKYRILYLSKSESNLFGLITAIFRYNRIPDGPLFLTQYQKFKSLFKSKDASHKRDFLDHIISNLPNKQFVLIGDDTQRDMDVYTEIVKKYKPQILKIYIRQTNFFVNNIQKEKWQLLKKTGVDCMYFQDENESNLEIQNLNKVLNL